LSEEFENFSNVLGMVFFVLAIDENVINVNNNEIIQVRA